MLLREHDKLTGGRLGEPLLGTGRAATAVAGMRVVESSLQSPHQALAVGAVARHLGLLGSSQGGYLLVALLVIRPGLVSSEPAAALAHDRAFHVEDLEQGLDPTATDVDGGQQVTDPRWPVTRGDRLDDRFGDLTRRERGGDEEVLDVAVLKAAEQHGLCLAQGPSRAPNLLVVGDDRAGRLIVHDEPEVRLVVAHTERLCGHHRLHVVREQAALDLEALLVGCVAAVGDGRNPARV